MTRKYPKIQNSIIKVVGLVEEKDDFQDILEKNQYYREELTNENSIFLKDYFYPDFRNLMFSNHSRVNNRRYKKEINQIVTLSDSRNTESFLVENSEVFLFGGDYIALFCISVQLENKTPEMKDISEVLNVIRQFDAITEKKITWCHWIENTVLGGVKIRGKDVTVDEYSGSKFKLFTVLDIVKGTDAGSRKKILYDLGTSSPLGSSEDADMLYSPHPDYYSKIMENKLSVFNNWELLSLLDTFTVMGTDILMKDNHFIAWDYTYFRIYLFRVFFKYNLYRYNSLMSDNKDLVYLRSRYEEFLNIFDTFPISYNFLPNEIFQHIGKGLDVQLELEDLHNRITRMTEAIKEKKQEQMNLLLGLISVLSAIASAAVIPDIIEQINAISGYSAIIYFAFLAFIIIIIFTLLVKFVKPFKRLKSFFSYSSRRKSR